MGTKGYSEGLRKAYMWFVIPAYTGIALYCIGVWYLTYRLVKYVINLYY